MQIDDIKYLTQVLASCPIKKRKFRNYIVTLIAN